MDASIELEDSLMEPVCDDDVVFFGPVTEKEKKICEQLKGQMEPCMKAQLRNKLELQVNDCNNSDESVYKSFSVEESKYESFIDSIDGEALENQNNFLSSFLPATAVDNAKKSVNMRRGNTLYDSLEDICSLVSNAEKLSISEEVENIYAPGKQFISEDSVNPCKIENKHSDEQIHFDEDSLAILEYEKTFDDSLEEFVLPACIEVRSVSCSEEDAEIANVKMAKIAGNHLDTSVQILTERLSFTDSLEEKDIFPQKQFKCDSPSSSEVNDVMKDSLVENDSLMLSNTKVLSETPVGSVINVCDKTTKTPFFEQNFLDASIQVVYEKVENPKLVSERYANANHDSLSSSECNAISKDSLDEQSKSEIPFRGEPLSNNCDKTSRTSFFDKNLLDASIQVMYEKVENPKSVLRENGNANCDSLSSSDCNAVSKDSLDELPNSQIPPKESSTKENALNVQPNELCSDIAELIHVPSVDNNFDTSVQILYENIDEGCCNKNENSNVHAKSKGDSFIVCSSLASNRFEDHEMVSNVKEINKTYVKGIKNHKVLQKRTAQSQVVKKGTPKQGNSTKSSLNDRIHDKCPSEENKLIEVTEKSFCSLEVHEKSYSVLSDINSENVAPSVLVNSRKNQCSDLNLKLHIELTVADGMKQIDSKNIEICSSIGCDGENKVDVCVKSDKDVTSKIETLKSDKAIEHSSYKQDFSQIRQKVLDKVSSKPSATKCSSNILAKHSDIDRLYSKMDIGSFNEPNVKKENLLQALDLHDTSISYKSNSILESRDSLMPLNLCLKDTSFNHKPVSFSRSESKENIPEIFLKMPNKPCAKQCKNSPGQNNPWKTPKQPNTCFYNSPKSEQKELKGNIFQKSSATKIPIRKDNVRAFVTPKSAEIKSESSKVYEKLKSPLSAKLVSRTATVPDATPKKIPHFCTLPSSISKVPTKSAAQLSSAKKYQYIQSPVGQYMRTPHTPAMKFATPVTKPLQCMTNVIGGNQGKETGTHVTLRKTTPQKTSKK
ncbi:uncharacterized protein LOC129222396 [Uloborus diversus]|uniref:uncharacterized protein LOC129222396 n=1 Tax=Uloborus diversus TaxID=327109 RepID=UPI002409A132|nr:uncharacterized protein LOC129222396 [Uloborus diversus]